MANSIIVNPTPVPPGVCLPGDANALIQFVAQYLSVEFNQQINFFNAGSTTPSVSNQDKPWFRTDSQGRPMGWYVYYNGAWRRSLTEAVGTLKEFTGSPAGVFDATGKGIVGSMWDGWAICNGQNGTPDLRNKFTVGADAHTSGGWVVSFGGVNTSTGGDYQVTLTVPNLPPHSHEVKGFYRYWRGSTPAGDAVWEADANKSIQTEATGGGQAFSILNPYFAAVKVMCIGY